MPKKRNRPSNGSVPAQQPSNKHKPSTKAFGGDYLARLKQRGQESKVYTPHQMTGLLLAEILSDEAHKSLYMKLAKEYKQDRLLELAKSVTERKNVKNKGAYFMRLLHDGEKQR